MKFLLLFLMFINVSYAQFSDKVKEQISSTSVKIIAISGNHGSGVIIGSNKKTALILTNRHVCQVMANSTLTDSFSIVIHNNAIYRGHTLTFSREADLCVIGINTKSQLPVSKISLDKNKVGEEIITVGYPADFGKYITSGFTGEGYASIDGNRYLQTSISTVGGQSGSGVFNDRGQIVGILSMASEQYSTLSGMVDLESIQKFMSEGK